MLVIYFNLETDSYSLKHILQVQEFKVLVQKKTHLYYVFLNKNANNYLIYILDFGSADKTFALINDSH